MVGAVLEVSYTDSEIQDALGRLRAFGGSRAVDLWNAIGGYGVSSTQLRFHDQVAPDGSPWKPSQRAVKQGGKTLIWHGYLLGSITYNMTADGVEWGSPMVYAGAMQGGADITSYARSQQIYRHTARDGSLNPRFVKKAKANFASWITIGEHTIHVDGRPYLGLNDEDDQEIQALIAKHIEAAIVGSQLGHS